MFWSRAKEAGKRAFHADIEARRVANEMEIDYDYYLVLREEIGLPGKRQESVDFWIALAKERSEDIVVQCGASRDEAKLLVASIDWDKMAQFVITIMPVIMEALAQCGLVAARERIVALAKQICRQAA